MPILFIYHSGTMLFALNNTYYSSIMKHSILQELSHIMVGEYPPSGELPPNVTHFPLKILFVKFFPSVTYRFFCQSKVKKTELSLDP